MEIVFLVTKKEEGIMSIFTTKLLTFEDLL